jgi:phosphoglycerate-specific signal transduction histidine kinase
MVDSLEEKQEELIQSKKMASIGTFSSGIAHEINNPLNNISLSTDTLIEEFDGMDESEIKEILEDIMTQTERASKIVRNLLDFIHGY